MTKNEAPFARFAAGVQTVLAAVPYDEAAVGSLFLRWPALWLSTRERVKGAVLAQRSTPIAMERRQKRLLGLFLAIAGFLDFAPSCAAPRGHV